MTYISVPDGGLAAEQPTQITLTPVVLTDALKERIKTESPYCKLIYERMQARIREKYCAEDEMYFSRISVGTLLGAYVFQPGEQQAVLDYGAYVESVRQWGRDERAAVGL